MNGGGPNCNLKSLCASQSLGPNSSPSWCVKKGPGGRRGAEPGAVVWSPRALEQGVFFSEGIRSSSLVDLILSGTLASPRELLKWLVLLDALGLAPNQLSFISGGGHGKSALS